MLQALRRLFKPRIIFYPELKALGTPDPEEWGGLMGEIAQSYERDKAYFRALLIWIQNMQAERDKEPACKTEADEWTWKERQKQLSYEINILRKVVRLPTDCARKLEQKAKSEAMQKMFDEELDD